MTVRVLCPRLRGALPNSPPTSPTRSTATGVPEVEVDDGHLILDGRQPICLDDLLITESEEPQ